LYREPRLTFEDHLVSRYALNRLHDQLFQTDIADAVSRSSSFDLGKELLKPGRLRQSRFRLSGFLNTRQVRRIDGLELLKLLRALEGISEPLLTDMFSDHFRPRWPMLRLGAFQIAQEALAGFQDGWYVAKQDSVIIFGYFVFQESSVVLIQDLEPSDISSLRFDEFSESNSEKLSIICRRRSGTRGLLRSELSSYESQKPTGLADGL
jgi:hypothetical protein